MLKLSVENKTFDIPDLNKFKLGDKVICDATVHYDRFEGVVVGIELQRLYGSEILTPSITLLEDGTLTDGFKPSDLRKVDAEPSPSPNLVGNCGSIPEDIMEAARDAAGHVYDPHESRGSYEYVRDLIACAILSDRQRCDPARQTKAEDLSPEETAIATCEACGKHIQEGEPYLWGPETDLCGECAPTYQALIDEPEGFVNADGEPLTPEQCSAWFDEHIAGGGKATDSIATVDRTPVAPPQEPTEGQDDA
ncbi:hypothetical protein [Neorhizobium sp. NCHU2750]|uniref:hypothetical protein n=1 Tax=Neorhizobium sp. NCHU2750 TaxID=1825976 RepID=UPI000E70A4ED|nr:hypothetical protein NCHU2750_05900 [Neorhizobium sp. NCHU2750]